MAKVYVYDTADITAEEWERREGMGQDGEMNG